MSLAQTLATLERPLKALYTIDFESYFGDDYTLKKMTTAAYVRDPRWETTGAAVKVNSGPVVWMEPSEFKHWAATQDWSTAGILCHHTHFDGLVLAHHYGVRPAMWFDTLSMARVLHGTESGSLEALAEKYGVGAKGKEILNARGKRRVDFTPEEYARFGEYAKNDVALTYDLFQKMRVGYPEMELWLIDSTIRFYTEPTFVLDEPLLQEYAKHEAERKAALMARLAALDAVDDYIDGDVEEKNAEEEARLARGLAAGRRVRRRKPPEKLTPKQLLMSNARFAKLLESLGVDPPKKISKTTGKLAYAFAKSDFGMQDLLNHHDEDVRIIAEARVGVKSTINQTRTERFLEAGKDGRAVPVYLAYAAAHTFRWGGGDRLNFQNLPRGGALRKSLLAPEGHVLVVADSAQIEARTLAWLGQHSELLSAFRENRDVYSEFASQIYGRKVDRKKNKEDYIPGFLGKVAVLGLGYSMGWAKFSSELLKGMLGGPPVQFTEKEANDLGVDIRWFARRNAEKLQNMQSRISMDALTVHCAVTAAVVKTYRDTNQPIVETWNSCEDLLEAMTELGPDESRDFGPGGCLRVLRHGVRLPNGAVMRYPGLAAGTDGYTYLSGYGGKTRSKIYGGLLTENLTQALARIIIGAQLLRVRALGWKAVSTTHDELILVAKEGDAEKCLDETLAAMGLPCEWCVGLPLGAEGGFHKSYGHAK